MNQREFLGRCLSSVANQSFTDYEHIVVDPGSRDGSREWVSSLADERLRLVAQPDNGPAQGLNHGIAVAKGDIILYVNADDALPPGALEAIARYHSTRGSADVLVGNGWTIDSDDEPIAFVRSDRFTPFRYALGVGTVLQQGTSFKRALFDRGLQFNEANHFNWDTELLFEAKGMGATFQHVDDALGYFRLQPNSITMSGQYEQGLKAERARLRAIGRAGVPMKLVSLCSLPARAIKRLLNVIRDRANPPVFPGLAERSV